MSTSALTLTGLLLSGIVYIGIALRITRRAIRLDDHLPIATDAREARVTNADEFSAATIATTISLATVVLAYTELASYFGLWLLWTVVTTTLGLIVVRLAAPHVWRRLAAAGTYRPTLHDFLGSSFGSRPVATIAALCTSVGFMGAFAVELTVGSKFLTGLVPGLPQLVGVVILASIGVGYTVIGGFRAVIVTDRIQMIAIWSALAAFGVLVARQIEPVGAAEFLARLPKSLYDFSDREGLLAFVVGIFVINVPTFVADMSIWQRIAGSDSEETVTEGLALSVFGVTISWTAFTLIACALVGLVVAVPNENPLLTYMRSAGSDSSRLTSALFLVAVTGLFAASLSTASTQLIAAGHALHIDVLRRGRDRSEMAESRAELVAARGLVFVIALGAIGIVLGLEAAGFSVADLVFAVYGAQLGMVPAVAAALGLSGLRLRDTSRWAVAAIGLGFAAGWAGASIGKWQGDANLVFLAPAISLAVSGVILGCGLLVSTIRLRIP